MKIRIWLAALLTILMLPHPAPLLWAQDVDEVPGAYDSEEAQEKAEAVVSSTPLGELTLPVEASDIPVVKQDGTAVVGLKDDIKTESPEVLEAVSDLKAKRTGFAIIVDLKSDVLFDFNKADIKPEAAASLAKVALIIKKKARGRVLIEGHTDSIGTDEYNQKLSERRAEAVRRWLADRHGINPDIMAIKGWGEARPAAPNTNPDGSDNPAGRALNRRVVITIPTAGSKDRPKTP